MNWVIKDHQSDSSLALVLCLIAFSLEAELRVILKFNQICRFYTPNKSTLAPRKIVSISISFFLFQSQCASSGSTAAIFSGNSLTLYCELLNLASISSTFLSYQLILLITGLIIW